MNTNVDMYEEDVYQLLLPLKSLTKLTLHSISKGSLPPDLLWRLPNLKTLVFTGNNLVSSTLGRALANVTTLTSLEVNSNRITVVNENTLPWEFRRTVKWLDMSKNPFSCTCDLMWFRSWLEAVQKNKSVTVKAYPGYNKKFSTYRCHSPVSWKNKDLRVFFASEDLCTVQNPYVVVGVAGGCVLMGLVVLVLAVYRYRWHLRFYLYRLRRSRQLPSQVPGGLLTGGEAVEFFPFDAYLAHSAQDLDWIHDELLPLVEVEHGLRLFVEERDSIPGSLIVDNITK
ncbi:hypothetical protein V1264_004541 [Littorina saxatilis]|uniref:TIR domain-containing protein n=2 Tax=Littorina saxatilis TaxID=31220 RepID=A0AAN9B1Q4_9CAEN